MLWFLYVMTRSTTLLGGGIFQNVKSCIAPVPFSSLRRFLPEIYGLLLLITYLLTYLQTDTARTDLDDFDDTEEPVSASSSDLATRDMRM